MTAKTVFWENETDMPDAMKVLAKAAGISSFDNAEWIRYVPNERKAPSVCFLKNSESGERPVEYKTDIGSFFVEYCV